MSMNKIDWHFTDAAETFEEIVQDEEPCDAPDDWCDNALCREYGCFRSKAEGLRAAIKALEVSK